MPALPRRRSLLASSISRSTLCLNLGASLGMGLALGLPALLPQVAVAQTQQQSYDIPAGDLGSALTRFAGLAGVSLSVEPGLVQGRQSSGLSGSYSVEDGFSRLLQGSGLQLQSVGSSYTLVPAPQTSGAPGTLEIGSTAIVSTSILSFNGDGERYAGNQVARRGSLGLLGSRDFMDTPLSSTTYTSETAKNLQARTLSDLVASDPSVRATNPAGGRFEQFTIRGFSLFNTDVSYNGLYGVLPTYSIDMEMADRVDVFKGTNQLLNGISPRGSIGGGVNVVAKRATEKPITEFTGSVASDSQVGGAVDIGRRFGDNNEYGIRFNSVKQSGDTEWDHQNVDRELSVLGLDFRGERLRVSADIGRTERDTDAPQERIQVGANARVPSAGSINKNYAQAWSWASTNDTFGDLNAEYDISDSFMVYGAVGARESNHEFMRHAVSVSNNAGDFTISPRFFTRDESVRTATVGARKWLQTGPVSHELNISATHFYMDFTNGGARYATAAGNIYNPVQRALPNNPTRLDSKDYTENRFDSIGLADTLGFFDDRLLVTLGGRFQRVQVEDWSDGVRGATAYDEKKFSPSGGVVYKVTDQWSLYANYMEGLSLGKIAPSTSVNENQIFAPFISRQLEIGSKYDLGSMAFTASVFRVKQPAYETNATTRVFGPSGKRENTGVELSVFGEPLQGVRLLGGVMYIHSELTDTVNGVYDGNRAPATPKYNVNLGAEWDVPGVQGVTLTARGIHSSSQYLDQANSKSIDSWQRVDLGARYAFKVNSTDVTLRANVENVLDKAYWASAGASDDSEPGLTLSTPRTYLLSATVGF